MGIRAHRRAMLALCSALSPLGFASPASASQCGPLRELVPLSGATFPGDGEIRDICYYYTVDGRSHSDDLCGPLVLEDPEGRRIELIEERQIFPAVGVPTKRPIARVITAYRPAQALPPGRYRLSATQLSIPLSNEFSVVESVATPPALPLLRTVAFESIFDLGMAMVFEFEPFEGTLAVERDGVVREPQEALDVSGAWLAADQPREFYLARELCQGNFPELDYGVSTTLRFGVLDAYGAFSGWTEPQLYTFPTREELDAQQAAAQEAARDAQAERDAQVVASPPGWCSFVLTERMRPGSGSGLLTLGALLTVLVERRHRRPR